MTLNTGCAGALRLKESAVRVRGYTFCASFLASCHSALGDDAYMDYGLIICQANGRPIMTEHLNNRFKEVLTQLNDPTIHADNVVFHSLRHTSTGVKLRLSKGDLKAVQGDGGWNSPDMVTRRYAHILDEDRRRLGGRNGAILLQRSKRRTGHPLPRLRLMCRRL